MHADAVKASVTDASHVATVKAEGRIVDLTVRHRMTGNHQMQPLWAKRSKAMVGKMRRGVINLGLMDNGKMLSTVTLLRYTDGDNVGTLRLSERCYVLSRSNWMVWHPVSRCQQ